MPQGTLTGTNVLVTYNDNYTLQQELENFARENNLPVVRVN